MRKPITAALAALSLVTGLTAASTADAQSRWRRGHDNTSTAIIAGAAGLALGAAISSRGGYGYGYGYPSYGYRYSYPSYGYGYGYPSYGYPSYGYGYGRPYYAPRYYAPPRPRMCSYWRYDRWGRAYRVRGYC